MRPDLSSIPFRVERHGVPLLDERMPDWRCRVDLDGLRCVHDVLAALFGDYPTGCSALGLLRSGWEIVGETVDARGRRRLVMRQRVDLDPVTYGFARATGEGLALEAEFVAAWTAQIRRPLRVVAA